MSGHTDYARNKITDAVWRGQALNAPATYYFGLICASKGVRANSTAYALNDTIVVLIGAKYQLYKCTTAGNSAAAQPGTYLGVDSEVITDGTAVFTEQTAALDAGTYAEVSTSGTGYARAALAASLANFAGTQAAGSTTASSGNNGLTSNNVAIPFPTPSGQWHPTGGLIVGAVAFDAAAAGNPWWWGMLGAGKNVNNGDAAPSFAIGSVTSQIGA
jgi:hypothetical protein